MCVEYLYSKFDLKFYTVLNNSLIYIYIFIGKMMKRFLPNLKVTGSSPVEVSILQYRRITRNNVC